MRLAARRAYAGRQRHSLQLHQPEPPVKRIAILTPLRPSLDVDVR